MSLLVEDENCPDSLGPWVDFVAYVASVPGCRMDCETGAGFDVYQGKKTIGAVLAVNRPDRSDTVVITLGPPCFNSALASHFYDEARQLVEITWFHHNFARTVWEISTYRKDLVVSSIELAVDANSEGNQADLADISTGDYVVFSPCVRTIRTDGERTMAYAAQFTVCKK